ncbi:uncharacterized protein LOC131932305 [Physella acuta]|uniref:uncharacterized protein LOC131932305 n=1 Tax=Physella acuta TaxID=109671 RepID=UPI0027DAE3A2|nr:uncharacterized protein LOC131932305 [Physella acuta]
MFRVWQLFAVCLVPVSLACSPHIKEITDEDKENFMYGINDERQSSELRNLRWNDALAEYAQQILSHTCGIVKRKDIVTDAYLAYCAHASGFNTRVVSDVCSYRFVTGVMMNSTRWSRLMGCAMTFCPGIEHHDLSLCMIAPRKGSRFYYDEDEDDEEEEEER